MRRAKSIPKFVDLPFGYPRIKVKQRSKSQMESYCEDTDGCWMVDDMTIYVCKSLPVKRKRYVYAHELLHAVHDWMLWCHYEGVTD